MSIGIVKTIMQQFKAIIQEIIALECKSQSITLINKTTNSNYKTITNENK